MPNLIWSAKNEAACISALADSKVLPQVFPGVPTSGGSGTLAGYAGKGMLLIDTTNGILYINTGSITSPTWTKVGLQT